MYSGVEPYNYEELQKLYAAIPEDRTEEEEQT